MLYDLNVPWSSANSSDLQRTISFLSERKSNPLLSATTLLANMPIHHIVSYSVLALTHNITSAIPSQITNPIPPNLSFALPPNLTILRRCTLTISDPSLNHRLPALAQAYDILALRPMTEKAFLSACTTIDNVSIISLDLSQRYPFHFRPKPFMTAIRRGIRFEICYAQAVQDNHGGAATADKRRNFISNTLAIVRATRGRGLIVSSEARTVLGVRAPADVANLLSVWGVKRELAQEAMTTTPRSVVVNEGIRRRGFRGVIDVVDGGERAPKPAAEQQQQQQQQGKSTGAKANTNGAGKNGKRKLDIKGDDGATTPSPVSKRQAKKLRLAALTAHGDKTSSSPSLRGTPPTLLESQVGTPADQAKGTSDS